MASGLMPPPFADKNDSASAFYSSMIHLLALVLIIGFSLRIEIPKKSPVKTVKIVEIEIPKGVLSGKLGERGGAAGKISIPTFKKSTGKMDLPKAKETLLQAAKAISESSEIKKTPKTRLTVGPTYYDPNMEDDMMEALDKTGGDLSATIGSKEGVGGLGGNRFGGGGGSGGGIGGGKGKGIAKGVPTGTGTKLRLQMVRLQYEDGDWFFLETALNGIMTEFEKRVKLGGQVVKTSVGLKAEDINDQKTKLPFIFITGHGRIRVSPEGIKDLRKYLESGGMLIANDTGGEFDRYFRMLISQVFGGYREFKMVNFDHDVYHSFYDLEKGCPQFWKHSTNNKGGYEAEGIFIGKEKRLAVFYSHTDVAQSWSKEKLKLSPAEVEQGVRMGVNLIMYALNNYMAGGE